MTTASFLSDLTRARGRTREHAADGAGVAGGARHRGTVLQLLNDLLASELIWLMRYRRQYLLWGGKLEVAEECPESEPTPADRLARRIRELGGEPNLDPDHLLERSRAAYASRGSVADMIREDLRAERLVIESYTDVIRYLGHSDPPTREMLEASLVRERMRAAQLAKILRELATQAYEQAG